MNIFGKTKQLNILYTTLFFTVRQRDVKRQGECVLYDICYFINLLLKYLMN